MPALPGPSAAAPAPARKRHRRANPDRPGTKEPARAHESSPESSRSRRLRPYDRRPGACTDRHQEALTPDVVASHARAPILEKGEVFFLASFFIEFVRMWPTRDAVLYV